MSHPTRSSQYGPEYFFVVVGYSSDAKDAADTIASLQAELQGELDKFRRVNRTIPFGRVEIWKWESHAAAGVGGQAVVIDPEMDRANAAVFVFNERVGKVTWEELKRVRGRSPEIPLLPFFPAKPPNEARMMDEGVAENWSDLLKKRRELAEHWTDPESRAITPLPQYSDLKDLKRLAFERLTGELVRIASSYAVERHPRQDYSPHKTNDFAVGLSESEEGTRPSSTVVSSSSGHVLSIAPSREGRYAATVVPSLCSYNAAALVVDPTGQIYKATADAREEMGTVVKLDPWGLVPDKRVGSLNPMDIVAKLGLSPNEGARFLADFIVPYETYQPRQREMQLYDPFWSNMQRKLLVGLILLVGTEANEYVGVLSRIRRIINSDDPVYDLAVKLDTVGKKIKETVPEAYEELASFLQQPDITRSGILAGVGQHFGAWGSLVVQRSTDTSSFDVGEWIRGEPVSVYLIGPPPGVQAFDSVYRLWCGSLLAAVLQRPELGKRPCFIVLDINESFELWPGVSTAITQKNGCRAWLIASDVREIEWAFGKFASSVLSAFSTIQVLRPNNLFAAESLCKLLGVDVSEIMSIESSEVLVSAGGDKAVRMRSVDRG